MPLSPEVKRALVERFNAKLPLKAAALSCARAALHQGGAPARVAARRLAHQLAGTAASFGWPLISTSASAVENADDPQLPAALDGLITLVRQAVVEAGVASRILLVEDQTLYAEYLQAGLAAPERSFDVVHSATEALERLSEHDYDLILLDILLPDADGRTLLTTLQDHSATASTPVIVLSQVRETTIESECLAYGAEAFFDKSVPLDRLSTAMANALARHHEHRTASRRDPATGLLNRAGLREAFGHMQARRRRQPTPAALALLDIDHFRQILKKGGPPAGELAIERLLQSLQAGLQKSDLVGRWGPDEFVVAFPEKSAAEATLALEHVQDRLHEDSSGDPAPTFSGGVVDIEPDFELELAVSRADPLLYAAKRTGRDRIAEAGLEQMMPSPRILLAEDDDDMATMVAHLLAQSGLEVDHRADGRAALEAARAHRYATIIVDRYMPTMDGYELIERLRADRRNCRVPIVVLTSASVESEIARAFELGADDYVHKPFKPVELIARIQRLARRTSSHTTTSELEHHATGH
ncbi:MAG: response regulator [Myxococcota bacterium]